MSRTLLGQCRQILLVTFLAKSFPFCSADIQMSCTNHYSRNPWLVLQILLPKNLSCCKEAYLALLTTGKFLCHSKSSGFSSQKKIEMLALLGSVSWQLYSEGLMLIREAYRRIPAANYRE